MADRLISGMQLDPSISNVFAARSILTAKDALCKTELELMELLDLPMSTVNAAVSQISLNACPPYRSVLTLKNERQEEFGFGHMKTNLREIDDALHGGIPFGALTEVVGPAGLGKTQLCLMLCVIAALPKEHGGLDGSALYFDTERKFHSGRMMEIAQSRYPHIFYNEDTVCKLATRVLVCHPLSLEDFMSSLQRLEELLIENQVKLLIVDSIAALMQSEQAWHEISRKQTLLAHQAATLKYVAESFRIPVVVTNQVRARIGKIGSDLQFPFEGATVSYQDDAGFSFQEDLELQLTSALGTSWAHSVNIRLTLESLSGQRFLKIAKSPLSAVVSFPYIVTSAGLELTGTEINKTTNEVMKIQNDGEF